MRNSTKGKELDPKKFNDQERKAFDDADADVWTAHIRTGTVASIPPETAKDIDRPRILQLLPRFVWTENNGKNPNWQSSKLIRA